MRYRRINVKVGDGKTDVFSINRYFFNEIRYWIIFESYASKLLAGADYINEINHSEVTLEYWSESYA